MKLRMVNESGHTAYAKERSAHFAARCRDGGLAVTPQRTAIIEALLASTDHPTAEHIYAAVRRRYPHISLATVHRTLETLCRIGEARKVTQLHDSARYDGNLNPHHHVVCVRCHRIRDIEVSGLRQVLETDAALGGFTPLGWSLEIQAVCDKCRRAGAQRASAALPGQSLTASKEKGPAKSLAAGGPSD